MFRKNSTSDSIRTIEDIFHKVRESHVRPGSYRLQRLLSEAYFHTLSFAPIILVGGTNGKGTTCSFLESILRHSNLRTGLYTSPHLVNVTERIRISGIPVFEKEMLDTIKKLDTNRQLFLPDATFFELMTAAALLLFYEKNVDIIICEVGLGGRYDSTNALNPLISVLTGVSLDHTHILGTDVSTIAQDKSYISRRNKPFVVNTSCVKVLSGISKTAKIISHKMILTSQPIRENLEQIFLEYANHKAKANLRTALTVVDCLQNIWFPRSSRGMTAGTSESHLCDLNAENIRKGIKNTFWPGRFDVRIINNRKVIFDCAHNPGGIKFFLEQYKNSLFSKQKYDLIFASLKDKDWKRNIKLLVPLAKNIKIIRFENERAENTESIFLYLKKYCPQACVSIGVQLKNSVQNVLDELSENPVLVIGSIAFVGAVFESLNIDVFPA